MDAPLEEPPEAPAVGSVCARIQAELPLITKEAEWDEMWGVNLLAEPASHVASIVQRVRQSTEPGLHTNTAVSSSMHSRRTTCFDSYGLEKHCSRL